MLQSERLSRKLRRKMLSLCNLAGGDTAYLLQANGIVLTPFSRCCLHWNNEISYSHALLTFLLSFPSGPQNNADLVCFALPRNGHSCCESVPDQERMRTGVSCTTCTPEDHVLQVTFFLHCPRARAALISFLRKAQNSYMTCSNRGDLRQLSQICAYSNADETA